MTIGASSRTVATTTGVKSLYPSRFLGGSVLLTRNDPGGATAAYDVWNPDQGAYRPSGPAEVHQLVGSTPDGQTILVAVPNNQGLCLARLDPSFALDKRACDVGLTLDGGVWPISPDGRWLLGRADGTKERGNPVALVDLTRSGPGAVVGTWPDDPTGRCRSPMPSGSIP